MKGTERSARLLPRSTVYATIAPLSHPRHEQTSSTVPLTSLRVRSELATLILLSTKSYLHACPLISAGPELRLGEGPPKFPLACQLWESGRSGSPYTTDRLWDPTRYIGLDRTFKTCERTSLLCCWRSRICHLAIPPSLKLRTHPDREARHCDATDQRAEQAVMNLNESEHSSETSTSSLNTRLDEPFHADTVTPSPSPSLPLSKCWNPILLAMLFKNDHRALSKTGRSQATEIGKNAKTSSACSELGAHILQASDQASVLAARQS